MKKIIFIFFTFLISCSITFAESVTEIKQPATIQWKNYSSNVFNEAKKDNHPVLLYVTSNSCGWCREMEETTFHNKNVIDMINTNYYPVTINGSKNRKLIKSYHVSSVPSIVIFDANGKAVHILSGYHSAEEALTTLEKLSSTSNSANVGS